MDLAKIRNKSLHSLTQSSQDTLLQDPWSAVELSVPSVNAKEVSTDDDEYDLFQNIPTMAISGSGVSQADPVPAIAEKANVILDPIEVIMAGRSASGCDEEVALADEDLSVNAAADLEFLCFRVFDELYAINIMDIKEIIKPREVTEVPRAPAFVTGVLSLRGTIIPVIDMRLRLGLLREHASGKERIVVIKINESFSGLLVDEVIQVVRVKKEAVEPAPAVLEGIDRDFVFGIGRSDGKLLIILNLESIADIHLC